MVLSSGKLKSLLDKHDFTEASNYVKHQLAEHTVSHETEDLVSSATKCINTLAFHLFNLNSIAEQTTDYTEITALVETFLHSMECLIGIPNATDIINATVVNKIILSSYHVSIKIL